MSGTRTSITTGFELLVYDAVIRVKLMYGLQSLELEQTRRNRSDGFQLKGLRQILKIKVTSIQRSNTNQNVYMEAWLRTKKEGRGNVSQGCQDGIAIRRPRD